MDTRREFLKKVAAMTAVAGTAGMIPESIARALAINPEVGTSFLDAEHVVILMQENRSFDHCYGTLQGVRGFNDPRAIKLPNKDLVWMQRDAEGKTYLPFRLDIKESKSTWMGSLPHSWTDQVDAGNHGKHDQWLIAKRPGNKEYHGMPLTMGYHSREDLPFYYSLADAFTVCDQNFCSSLTGTTPNRLYLWSGTIRETPTTDAYANVRNENIDYGKWAKWKSYPERLEENNVSWKIYQNELSAGAGFEGEQDSWLSNFTDNPIEWFERYHVKFSKVYRDTLPDRIRKLKDEISRMESSTDASQYVKRIESFKKELIVATEDLQKYTEDKFAQLSDFEKRIHEKAFTTNINNPSYHDLVSMKYNDGNEEREMQIPAGDTLYQFREDVRNKTLPTVSWLVAPENFSDHPGAPWYGAWYVSEVMDILTKDPEVWKKTIFILAYDENDGYFDHIPPFSIPDPTRPHTGKVSSGIDTEVEFVTLEQDKVKKDEQHCRQSPIGLGYRVPLVVASPWSRGGMVCSEVFDHTSVLQFLEKFLAHKTGKPIQEENISAWRRTICGDLTSCFSPYNGEKIDFPIVLNREQFLETVHRAKFKNLPQGFQALTSDDIRNVNRSPLSSSLFPKQEQGTRGACSLPYELYADGHLSPDRTHFQLSMKAGNNAFGERSAGAPYSVYATGKFKDQGAPKYEPSRNWAYAVRAGDALSDQYQLTSFEEEEYKLAVYGPNGFYREFEGDLQDPQLVIECQYERNTSGGMTGNIVLKMTNNGASSLKITLADKSYGSSNKRKTIAAKQSVTLPVDLKKSSRWYDFVIQADGYAQFMRRYAGRVENGEAGVTDPAMGASIS